jgi:predicted RNA-binding protein with PUA-like domain
LIKALLILKEEEEPILTSRPLPWKRRLKICTLKVDLGGTKFGELFLKIAFQYCVDNNISEVYLTHYHKEGDALSYLLESFGFGIAGILEDKEEVYLKSLLPSENNLQSANLIEYYPCYRDDEEVKKFLVPVRPKYHDRLFPDYQPRQYRLTEPFEINIPGNAIRKAYLSHSKTKKISPGDVLLFYRSHNHGRVTSIGVVEQTSHTNDSDEILRFIGQRSVYSQREIEDLAKKQVLAILFTHNLNLPTPLALNYLREHGIIQFAPQSIMEIQHNQYKEIIKGGGVDERFTLH